jgi:PleD family two-component response regulator
VGGRRSVYDRVSGALSIGYWEPTGAQRTNDVKLKYMNHNTHVLVVDDEPETCELVRDYLTGEGYRVSTAHDGARMRRMIAQNW